MFFVAGLFRQHQESQSCRPSQQWQSVGYEAVSSLTLEGHLTPLVQPVCELPATERGSGGFSRTDTPKGTVPPSPGKLHPPSQEEGAQISPVSSSTLTLLSPSRAQE